MVFIIIAVIALLIGADQLFKFLAVKYLQGQGPKDFIKFGDFDVLGLSYCENRGAAFSSFSGQKWLLIGLTGIMIIAISVYLIRMKERHPLAVTSLTMVIAGGIGNLIDRIRIGYVVDYFEVRMFRFAIFNFADILVVCGVILYLVYMLFIEGRGKADKNASESGDSSDGNA